MNEDEFEARSNSKTRIMVGEDLTHFSKEELTKRIVRLNDEIERTQAELKAKDNHTSIAENLFKTST